MKKRAFILIIMLSFFTGGIAALISFFSVKIMNAEEEALLKEGKTFWNWDSPYGQLSIHYEEKGEGANHILLIHGFRAHAYTWKLLTGPLSQAGYHVWTLDLIGYGLSEKPHHVIYNQDFFVAQIKAFMHANQIQEAHIVGNSMGGAIALELALDNPLRVRTLTIINGLGYSLKLPSYLYILRYMDFIWGPFLNPFMIRNSLHEVVHNKEFITDEKVEAYCLPYRFPGGISASLLTMRQFDLHKLENMHFQFSQIKQPTLILWGKEDGLIPLEHYHQFVADLPSAKSILITDCGHMPQEEKPEQVVAALLSFFDEAKN